MKTSILFNCIAEIGGRFYAYFKNLIGKGEDCMYKLQGSEPVNPVDYQSLINRMGMISQLIEIYTRLDMPRMANRYDKLLKQLEVKKEQMAATLEQQK